MAKNEIKMFDYSDVPADTKGKLIWYAGEIFKHEKACVENGLAAGKMLIEARELCGQRRFSDWVEMECGFSIRTAYNYMSAFEAFGKCATVAHIELGAMYELAKNEKAKKRAIKLSEKGVKVTQSMAKRLCQEEKGQISPSPPSRGGSVGPGKDEVTEDTGTDAQEPGPRPPRNGTDQPGDLWNAPPEEYEDADSVVLDAIGRTVPEALRKSHALSAAIQVEGRKLDAILREIKRLGKEPGGEFLPTSKLELSFKAIKGDIFGACYWSECPKCRGKNGNPCRDCNGRRWWPLAKRGHVSAEDKSWLGLD